MIYGRNYFNHRKNICFEAIQNGPNPTEYLKRYLSSSFYRLRSENHVKFTEECVMYTKKNVLVKKMFTNEQNLGLTLQAGVEKSVHIVERLFLW